MSLYEVGSVARLPTAIQMLSTLSLLPPPTSPLSSPLEFQPSQRQCRALSPLQVLYLLSSAGNTLPSLDSLANSCRSQQGPHSSRSGVHKLFQQRASQYFRLCGPYSLCCNDSPLLLWRESHHRWYVNKWVWLCLPKNYLQKQVTCLEMIVCPSENVYVSPIVFLACPHPPMALSVLYCHCVCTRPLLSS